MGAGLAGANCTGRTVKRGPPRLSRAAAADRPARAHRPLDRAGGPLRDPAGVLRRPRPPDAVVRGLGTTGNCRTWYFKPYPPGTGGPAVTWCLGETEQDGLGNASSIAVTSRRGEPWERSPRAASHVRVGEMVARPLTRSPRRCSAVGLGVSHEDFTAAAR